MARPHKGITFHDRVRAGTVINEQTGCWEWTGHKDECGYGRIQRGDRLVRLHRESWKDANGPIPDGLCVCHRCDNPCCINLEHLFLGTHADNMRDKAEKGRVVFNPRFGEDNPCAKLTSVEVVAIKRDLRHGVTRRALAEKHKVTVSNIDTIANGLTWRHIEVAA
jgi:hypothetical protein